MPVKKGDKIKVEYEGRLEDGTVFDSSKTHGAPLEFEVGGRKVIKGFDDGVIGMELNEEKEIRIEPKDAYGDRNPELIKKVPKDQLPKEHELKPGMMLLMGMPNGAQLPVTITEVGDKEVTLDLNHPLAGKTLIFKVKVVEIA
ncbi:peptidylprolyl isomerase [Candidatus Woesearchaeota archaeon]|nr:MAG: peptidylprolyl isomerase [Candidatus Woesearchaeota archaeon]